jgi:hypothetical protein
MKISMHALLMLKSVETATIQFCVLNKSPTPIPYRNTGRLPVDSTENGGDGPDGRLHCEDGAEPGLAVGYAIVGLGGLG